MQAQLLNQASIATSEPPPELMQSSSSLVSAATGGSYKNYTMTTWDDTSTTNKNTASTTVDISALLNKAAPCAEVPKADMKQEIRDIYSRYKEELEKFRRSEEKVTTLKKENQEWKDATAKVKIEMEQLRITYEGTIQSFREQLDAHQSDNDEAQNQVQE